jgi:hypothetical protein
MKNYPSWKDNSDENTFQYNFFPPPNWSNDRIKEEQIIIIETLNNLDSRVLPEEKQNWVSLASRLPQELRRALIFELNLGNKITGIGSSNWPNHGSIVVNVSERFNAGSHSILPEVNWRTLNDPHYCREELSQKFQGVEHLIIT